MKKSSFYLASLNLDYFFKKVFCHETIAKRFIENLLDIVIQEIELIETDFKVTDKSATVKFDFRCKVNDDYIIIEMQRGYPLDVVKRFYLYFAMGTAIQMEDVYTLKKDEEKSILGETGKVKKVKDEYKYIKPHIIIVWMANDSLKFKQGLVKYTVLPEDLLDFIQDDKLWSIGNLENLQKRRNLVLEIVQNNSKGLHFLRENKLIFAFQKKIVKDKNIPPTIKRWFDFAERTSNYSNTEDDFVTFEKDDVFLEMMRLLNTKDMKPVELDLAEELAKERYYIQTEFEEEKREAISLAVKQVAQEIEKEKQLRIQAEKGKVQAEQEKVQAEQEKIQERQRREQLELEKEKIAQQLTQKEQEAIKSKVKSISKMLEAGISIEMIVDFSNSTLEEVKAYIKIIEAEKEQSKN